MERPGVGRNNPCPCGSGRKFKKCCLARGSGVRASPVGLMGGPPALARMSALLGSGPSQSSAASPASPHARDDFWCGDDSAEELAAPDPALAPLLPVEVFLGYTYSAPLGRAEVTYLYPAGQTVCLADGDFVLNEDLRPGMRVLLGEGVVAEVASVELSYDLPEPPRVREDGLVLSRVVGTIKHPNLAVMDVHWQGTKVTGSPDHLWYSVSRRAYVQAHELEVGEFLRADTGRAVQVEGLSEVRYGPIDLYNVEVEFYHNYHVGHGEGRGALVHNGTEYIRTLQTYSLVDQLKSGTTPMLGEGNFSFAKDLAQKPGVNPANLVATEYRAEADLSVGAQQNIAWLRDHGVRVVCGVDARNIGAAFGAGAKFDNIIWNFPYGYAGPGRGGHHIRMNKQLMRTFFSNVASHLTTNGSVIFTLHKRYFDSWEVPEAAGSAGLGAISKAPYQLGCFPGYQPTTTYSGVNPPVWSDALTYIFKKGGR